jgi:predicted DNA-binding transcriptional regulator YafY
VLLVLARAATRGRRARLILVEPDGQRLRREVEVLALAYRMGRWLAAASLSRGGLRLLDLSRVASAAISPRRARGGLPGTFDAAGFAGAELLDPTHGSARPVALALTPRLARLPPALVPALVPGGRAVAGPGGPELRLLATSREALAALAAALGPGVSILAPAEWAGAAAPTPGRVG